VIQSEFEQIYDNYTHMMLFANSNKLKLENMQQEVAEIKKACAEILETTDPESSLNSLKALKSRLEQMQEEVKAILYQYREIDDMLHQVDVMIADYYEMDIEIDLYELNGIEKDLLGVKDENGKFHILKSEIEALSQKIEDKVKELKH
jgi:gas vesicle protein